MALTDETALMRVSTPNIVIIGVTVAAAAIAAVAGHWQFALILLVVPIAVLVLALIARSPEASTLLRVGALQWRTERDRDLGRRGFAVVGMVAVAIAFVEFLVSVLAGPLWLMQLFGAQLVVFGLVLGWANRHAVARH